MADRHAHSLHSSSVIRSSHTEPPIVAPADTVEVVHSHEKPAGTDHVTGIPVNLNPAGLPEGKEFKYERVETVHVDKSGHAELVDAREDRGKEDPGMNYKDMRPLGIPPGVPIGVISSAVSGTAPEIPRGPPGPFIPTAADMVSHDGTRGGSIATHSAVTETEKSVGGRTDVVTTEKVTSSGTSQHPQLGDVSSLGSAARETERSLGGRTDVVTTAKVASSETSPHPQVGDVSSLGSAGSGVKTVVKEEKIEASRHGSGARI